LINLLPALGPADAYTFISDGRPALLDHLLVSPALWPHTVAAQTLPFNTNFPETMQDDPRTACRASDHDPLEGRFVLASA
jgi:predicted extracellular nuclease